MGNRCYVCDKKCDEYIILSDANGFREKVECHYNCRPVCDCGEIYNLNKWNYWMKVWFVPGIIHKCNRRKCVSCDLTIGTDKFTYIKEEKKVCWHTQCKPSDNDWPICNETNITYNFCAFPREYRKYMLFQYWTLRRFIHDKNIVWKIITLAIYPYGYATSVQNGIPMTKIKYNGKPTTETCRCGELKQYLTNYTPRCIHGCVNYNIDQICQILNISTNLPRDQKLITITNLLN